MKGVDYMLIITMSTLIVLVAWAIGREAYRVGDKSVLSENVSICTLINNSEKRELCLMSVATNKCNTNTTKGE